MGWVVLLAACGFIVYLALSDGELSISTRHFSIFIGGHAKGRTDK
jgi:hypothetical protein